MQSLSRGGARGRREDEEEEEEEGSRWYRNVRSPWLTMMRRVCVFTRTRLRLRAALGLSLFLSSTFSL